MSSLTLSSSAALPQARIYVYATALGTLAAIVVVGLAGGGVGGPIPIVPVALLGAVGFLAERQSVHIASRTQMSVSVLPMLFAAVLYGSSAAVLVGIASLLSDLRQPYVRWVIWTASRAIVAGATAVAATLLGDQATFAILLAAVALAAITEAVVDTGLNALTGALRGAASPIETARAMSRMLVATVPLYTPVIAVLVYAYRELSPWTSLLFFVPALAAQRLFALYQQQRELTDELVDINQRLEKANLSFASALVATLDARDGYTAGHSAAVAIYARDIASRMGLSDEEQALVHLCGLVHDIGKIGLPAGLLEKTGPLTLDERRQMERHSEIGERILRKVEGYGEIARMVRHHHERVDGMGYPDGLRGGEIPLLARIIAVADAYDAMTSDRPYRPAMPSRVARLRLAQAVESQFDTAVVAAFEAILAGADSEYRRDHPLPMLAAVGDRVAVATAN